MHYVPPMLRLKRPELIERWEKLAVYARATPAKPSFTHFRNVLDGAQFTTAMRSSVDPAMVFFLQYAQEDLEAIESAQVGQEVRPLHTEYKVSEKVPFITRRVDFTHLRTRGDGGLDVASKGSTGLRGAVRLVRTALTTDALIPSAEELDDLLAYLENANAETKEL